MRKLVAAAICLLSLSLNVTTGRNERGQEKGVVNSSSGGVAKASSRYTDTLTGGRAINFAVDEAVRQLRQSLGEIQIEDLFDIPLTSENTDVPQSSAAFYLQRLTQEANLSAILIITDMTICFVAHGANIVMFDSHLHGNFGALVASTTVENTENFLKVVKEMISPNCNMCSLNIC